MKPTIKSLVEQAIVSNLQESTTHPYHAKVNFIAHYDGEKEEPFITGSGKTSKESRKSALNTHRLIHHGSDAKHYEDQPVDHDDDNDSAAHEDSKHDVSYRVSEKAHNHIHDTSKHHDINGVRGRHDGYEFLHSNMPELHYNHEKKTISHVSEKK